MALVQWVNLEKHADYAADSDIGSEDRCGALEIKTAFASGSVPLSYKVKVTPSGSDDVTYTTAELGRNKNFKMTKGATDLGTSAEVVMSDTVKLPAAGGNKYKLEAKDANGKVVKSEEIEAKRKLYYQFMHMEDTNGKVTPYALTQMEGHCANYHIVLSKAGTDKKIPFHKCVNSGAGGRFSHVGFAADVRAEYDLTAPQKKVGCVTALSNYVASFKSTTKTLTHSIGGPANPKISITPSVAAGVATTVGIPGKITLSILTGHEFLWYGLDDDDDLAKVWFIDGAASFTPNTSSASPSAMAGQSIQISRTDVSIGGTKMRTHGGHQVIEVTVNPGSTLDNMISQASGTLDFAFELNRVKGFSGGFSWGGAGFALTTCCTKAWFEDKQPSKSDVIWNHEIGHRMGMVAFGDKPNATYPNPKLPDAPPHLYGEKRGVNDKGHQGPHCEEGAVTYNATTKRWSGTPGCVLFGATGTSAASSPLTYCSDCEPVVRKLDLSF